MARGHASPSREKRAFWASFITYETFCKTWKRERRTIHHRVMRGRTVKNAVAPTFIGMQKEAGKLTAYGRATGEGLYV